MKTRFTTCSLALCCLSQYLSNIFRCYKLLFIFNLLIRIFYLTLFLNNILQLFRSKQFSSLIHFFRNFAITNFLHKEAQSHDAHQFAFEHKLVARIQRFIRHFSNITVALLRKYNNYNSCDVFFLLNDCKLTEIIFSADRIAVECKSWLYQAILLTHFYSLAANGISAHNNSLVVRLLIWLPSDGDSKSTTAARLSKNK